ncbi:MaoC family dehydratase [Salibacterium aidingense]|uniref:MaoC family dehydratase n=1 Tax=Salibacterium aidingense TaxID=384933 RepID=UPI000418A38E|nr:MaoC/PaaZ C-terminal domain-containing protein [Salibacterium aidingense]
MIDLSWEGMSTEVHLFSMTRENIRNWAVCLHDCHPLYLDPAFAVNKGFADVLMPPTYPMVFWNTIDIPWRLSSQKTLLHEKQEFHYYAPITADQPLKGWIKLENIEETRLSTGTFQRVIETMKIVSHQLLLMELLTTTLTPIRCAGERGKQQKASPIKRKSEAGSLSFPLEWVRQYAYCSGDNQAIHLNEQAARKAGFPRQVVQGMLIMGAAARCLHPVLDLGCYIKKYRCGFLSPLFAGDTLYFPPAPAGRMAGMNQDGRLVMKGSFQ